MIYFIGTDWESPVKIGKANDPEKRLRAIQVGNPNDLKILHLEQGGHLIEKRLHRCLSEFRIRGEWFEGDACRKMVKQLEFVLPERAMKIPSKNFVRDYLEGIGIICDRLGDSLEEHSKRFTWN